MPIAHTGRRQRTGQELAPIIVDSITGPELASEGALLGRPTVVVRTGGCDSLCRYCDSLHAVLATYRMAWHALKPYEILAAIQALTPDPILVTLTGGNPALQPLGPLLHLLKERGEYTCALETQGTVAPKWLGHLDYLTVCPPSPSSGERVGWPALNTVLAAGPRRTILKLVVFDEDDYQYARQVAKTYPKAPMYLQVGNHAPPDADGQGRPDPKGVARRHAWLAARVLRDHWYEVTVLPQLRVPSQ